MGGVTDDKELSFAGPEESTNLRRNPQYQVVNTVASDGNGYQP